MTEEREAMEELGEIKAILSPSWLYSPWSRQLSLDSEPAGRTLFSYCSFAYSALASFRIGISGSALFQSAKKS